MIEVLGWEERIVVLFCYYTNFVVELQKGGFQWWKLVRSQPWPSKVFCCAWNPTKHALLLPHDAVLKYDSLRFISILMDRDMLSNGTFKHHYHHHINMPCPACASSPKYLAPLAPPPRNMPCPACASSPKYALPRLRLLPRICLAPLAPPPQNPPKNEIASITIWLLTPLGRSQRESLLCGGARRKKSHTNAVISLIRLRG